MSSTSAEVRLKLTATEILSLAEAPAAAGENDRVNRFAGFGASTTLTETTTPAIEKPPSAFEITLGGGITTLDFTALPLARDVNVTHDYTGKRVVAATLEAPSNNAGAVTIAPGATHPYPLFGTGNERDLEPGECEGLAFVGAGSNKPAVSGTVKTVDVSGTSGDKLKVMLLFGT